MDPSHLSNPSSDLIISWNAVRQSQHSPWVSPASAGFHIPFLCSLQLLIYNHQSLFPTSSPHMVSQYHLSQPPYKPLNLHDWLLANRGWVRVTHVSSGPGLNNNQHDASECLQRVLENMRMEPLWKEPGSLNHWPWSETEPRESFGQEHCVELLYKWEITSIALTHWNAGVVCYSG